MKISVKPGKYVVAISGGVDSVVLLHLLQQVPGVEIVVAHFDHGIRPDSSIDRKLVQKIAETHGLDFDYSEGKLGPKASEATAREARYKFLRKVKKDQKADAIITAHHQDDLIETAIINLLRGTGHRGLASLKDTDELKRPLLGINKKQIKAYARKCGLVWREDITNTDTKYLRNEVRQYLAKNLKPKQRQQLLNLIIQTHDLNKEINTEIATLLQLMKGKNLLKRKQLINLPHEVTKEVLADWLRSNKISFDKKTLERLVIAIKTLTPRKKVDINHKHYLKIRKDDIILASHASQHTSLL